MLVKISAEMISSGVNTPGYLLIVDSVSACYVFFHLNRHLETCEKLYADTMISKSTVQSAHPSKILLVGPVPHILHEHPSVFIASQAETTVIYKHFLLLQLPWPTNEQTA